VSHARAVVVAALLASATATVPAHAEDRAVDLGGRFMSYARVPLESFEKPFQQVSTSAWLDVHAHPTKGTFANATATADLLAPAVDGRIVARGDLREAYAGAHDDALELRVGRQIVNWSNADLAGPLDVLGARDLTFFSATPEAQRIGQLSALVSFAPPADRTPLRLAAIVQPVFIGSKVLLPETPPNVHIDPEAHPTPSLQNTEVGVKLGWAPGGWDAALVAFRGFDHTAEATVASVTTAGDIEIARSFRSILVGGAQASTTAGDWILRFEAAYTMRGDGGDPRTEPSHADAVVGVERPLGDRIRVQAQALGRMHPSWRSPDETTAPTPNETLVARRIANVNAALFDFRHQARAGGTLRAAFTTEDERFELSASGIAWAVGFEYAVQPEIAWRVLDSFEVRAGAQVFGGEEGPLGSLHRYSGAYAQTTYTF
jgi:hypothetical protein